MLECIECGIEVKPVVKATEDSKGQPKIWGKGETNQGKYYHATRSKDGVSRCAKQFLTEDEVQESSNS